MDTRKCLGGYIALAGGLNLAWELAQLRLYTIYQQDAATLAYALAHCTAGDMLIAGFTYLVAAAATRSWRWPLQHPLSGLAAAIPAGVAYTALSEWLNVYVKGSWAYTDAMPLVFGIGLAPLLQWLVLPAVQVAVLRRVDQDQSAAASAR